MHLYHIYLYTIYVCIYRYIDIYIYCKNTVCGSTVGGFDTMLQNMTVCRTCNKILIYVKTFS